MDAKKALYRAKLKESAQKREKRIDSPLVRYNENDQPICRVCDVVLKSDSNWAAHQASRKHHEAITKFKANAAGQTQKVTKSEPPTALVHKTQLSSPLPADFFDKGETKRQKTGLSTVDKTETVASLDSASSGKILGKRKDYSLTTEEPSALNNPESNQSGVRGALPEGFFDNKGIEGTGNMDVGTTGKTDGSEIKLVNGSLPEGFFDKEDTDTNKKLGGSEVKQVKGAGALPEGFFDNKDADLRARGIEPVKIDIKDEYKEFEKLIKEDLHEVDERYEEEEIDAAEVREEEETLEQKGYRERVEMLRRKQMELKAARFGGKKSSAMEKDSSDEDSSSEDDEDKENFAVDWRAMHM